MILQPHDSTTTNKKKSELWKMYSAYEQFSVAADFNCSNTTKMGFCKCRHLLTVKSIFLIFFMHLNWFGKHLNLKYERKLKFFKIFHKSRNFWVSNIPNLKFGDLWNILKIFCLRSYFKFECVHSQIRRTKKIRKIDFIVN